jgi:RNA polymerase sigma-70 factor (ECF subfamily)
LNVSASSYDLELIQRCLSRDRQAWEALVDRSWRIVVQVVRHTGRSRGIAISASDSDDLVAEVFLELCRNDFAVLRRFAGHSSYSTYLSVIARRVVVRNLVKRTPLPVAEWSIANLPTPAIDAGASDSLARVTELLEHLGQSEAELLRLHHLEGCSYQEISRRLGIPENSVGPQLSRAREKLRAEQERQELSTSGEQVAPLGPHRRAA